MSLWESLRIAARCLWANRLRSFLTMLGIIIGVASVVTMIAVGAGAQTKLAEEIRSLGANVLMILPGAAREGAVRKEAGTRHTLTESDARAIGREIGAVRAAAPSVRGTAQAVAGNRNWNTTINGTTAAYFAIREWPVSAGRFFSPGEQSSAAKVALVGRTVARELFGADRDPVGQTIRIANTPFEVIGVLGGKGPTGTGRDQDDVIFIPISTAKQRLVGRAEQVNRDSVGYVLAKAVSGEAMAAAESDIAALLRRRHRLTADEPDDFRITDPAAAMAVEKSATRTVAWLLAAIASISLVVGGIGIMNIMLVSVTERTREIGLRLALGARRRDVRDQFMIEAVTLCLAGGILGIVLGVGSAVGLARLADWPVLLGPESMIAALVFAAAVGLFFGYYPAWKASRLDPIEALRAE